jgi:hypothetical protein
MFINSVVCEGIMKGVVLCESWEEEGDGRLALDRIDGWEGLPSSSEESDKSILTRRPGSILTRDSKGASVHSVEELRGVRRTVEAFMDSGKLKTRYLPGLSFQTRALLSNVTAWTYKE